MDQWNTISEKRQRVTEREREKERGRERDCIETSIQTPGISVKSLSSFLSRYFSLPLSLSVYRGRREYIYIFVCVYTYSNINLYLCAYLCKHFAKAKCLQRKGERDMTLIPGFVWSSSLSLYLSQSLSVSPLPQL